MSKGGLIWICGNVTLQSSTARFTLLITHIKAYKGRSVLKQFEIICTKIRKVKGGKGAKDMDAKIRVQKGLATPLSTVTLTKQFDRVYYNYKNYLDVNLK